MCVREVEGGSCDLPITRQPLWLARDSAAVDVFTAGSECDKVCLCVCVDEEPIRQNSFYLSDANADTNAIKYKVCGSEEGCYYREGDTGNKRKAGTMERGRRGDCHFWPPHHALIFTIDCIRSTGSLRRICQETDKNVSALRIKKGPAECGQKYLE